VIARPAILEDRVALKDDAFARVRGSGLVFVGTVAALLAGCAATPNKGGDPGAKPLPAGQSCASIKSELDRMVSRGVQGSVEAQSAGNKLSANQKTDADRYNQLLGQYLGSRCHV
jgi:hypothetical protein